MQQQEFTEKDHEEARQMGVSLGKPVKAMMEIHHIELCRVREKHQSELRSIREELNESENRLRAARQMNQDLIRQSSRWEMRFFVLLLFAGVISMRALSITYGR